MQVEISKEEADTVIIQLGGRIDYFNGLIVDEGIKGNVVRIEEILEHVKPMKDFRNRLMNIRYY